MSVAPQLIEGGRDSRRTSEPTSENTSYEHFIDRISANRPLRTSENPNSTTFVNKALARPKRQTFTAQKSRSL